MSCIEPDSRTSIRTFNFSLAVTTYQYMEKIFELEKLISKLECSESYFLTFLSSRGIDAGILRLLPGEEDVQEPHPSDEIYLVMKGDGFIRINDRKYELKKNSFVYVPANVEHKFCENKEELLVAYFLAS